MYSVTTRRPPRRHIKRIVGTGIVRRLVPAVDFLPLPALTLYVQTSHASSPATDFVIDAGTRMARTTGRGRLGKTNDPNGVFVGPYARTMRSEARVILDKKISELSSFVLLFSPLLYTLTMF